jgi:hypothetical protein
MLATIPPSHDDDGTAEVTWPRRDIGGRVMLMIMLLSHAGDSTAEGTFRGTM